MSSRLQLDMRNLSPGRRHLVNAYEVEAGIGVIAGWRGGCVVGAVAVWVASRPEACRLSQLQGCGFESAPLTSIA